MQQLIKSAPYFPVPDVTASATHYESVLGFTKEYSTDDPPDLPL
jgi:hypothetical protein